jgi:hypothetical protein
VEPMPFKTRPAVKFSDESGTPPVLQPVERQLKGCDGT